MSGDSSDLPGGTGKVLAERIEVLCEAIEGLRKDVRELRGELRGDLRDLEGRVRMLEAARARDEGSNYDVRIATIASRVRAIDQWRWAQIGAAVAGGSGAAWLMKFLGGD